MNLSCPAQAIKDFTRVLGLQPDNTHALFRRAFSFKALGKFEEAAEDFENARSIDPENPALVVNYKKISDVSYIVLVPPGEEPM